LERKTRCTLEGPSGSKKYEEASGGGSCDESLSLECKHATGHSGVPARKYKEYEYREWEFRILGVFIL
jgi:hypothetical protein